MSNLFAYGTLQIPEVLRAVTGRDGPAQAAVLAGYARYGLKGLAYPGLVAESGALTDGQLISGIGPRELALLDAFEDDFYQRITVCVNTRQGESVEAEVYVIPPECMHLIDFRPWTLDAFVLDESPGFLQRCRAASTRAGA